MGSPGGGDREKDLSKRRRSESSHYVKARDWDDDEAYVEDRRHRSSKSKKSSKSDREREKKGEKDEREREHDRVGRDEYYEKGEKRLRLDRHEERSHEWEFVESRAGSSKRRHASEKSSKKTEGALVKDGAEADDVDEGIIWKHDKAYELEDEKARKAVTDSPEKERGRKGELRADRALEGLDEKYRRSDSRSARGEALDEDSARKRSSHRDRHYGKEEERLRKKENIRAERVHDYVEADSRRFETRAAERFSDDEKTRRSDIYVEGAQNGDTVNDLRVDLKVDLRADKIYESHDSLRSRKGDYKVDRTNDIDEDTNVELRAGRTISSSGLDPSHSKSRKYVEEKKSERAVGHIYDERDTRDVELQAEGVERYVESSGLENHHRSSSRNEKGRENVGRDRGTCERERPGEVVFGVDEAAVLTESKHKSDRKRNGSGKSRGDKGEREESKKERASKVEWIDEDRVVARFDHREELRDPPVTSEDISESRDEKGSGSHSRRKDRAASRWDKPEPVLEEVAEPVIEKGPRWGNGAERIESKWNESEEDTLTLEEERDIVLPEPESVDVIESEEAEEGNKYAVLDNLGECEPIAEYEVSQDFEKLIPSAEADPGGGEQDYERQLEKPERHRRAKERLEREELDEWEKSIHSRERVERDWKGENRHFYQGRDKSEWEDVEDGSKLEGELEEGGEEVRKSGRRRGRDTLEREDYDFGGRFLGRDEKEREREREKEREKERLRERDKGKQRERERGERGKGGMRFIGVITNV